MQSSTTAQHWAASPTCGTELDWSILREIDEHAHSCAVLPALGVDREARVGHRVLMQMVHFARLAFVDVVAEMRMTMHMHPIVSPKDTLERATHQWVVEHRHQLRAHRCAHSRQSVSRSCQGGTVR